MNILLISFVTSPHRGSEGGVGWNFLHASALAVAFDSHAQIDFVFDARDASDVRAALKTVAWASKVSLHPVSLPQAAIARFGDRRTRLSYAVWQPLALRYARRLARDREYGVAHQVTFATSSMPQAIPRIDGLRIWGPLAVPEGSVTEWGRKSANVSQRAGVKAGILVSKRTLRKVDRIVCQNDRTLQFIREIDREAILEPNIIVEPRSKLEPVSNSIVFAGNLIDRKRPWVALEVLNDLSMSDFSLKVIGDGPLRSAMESYVRLERLESRVEFVGRLSHLDTIDSISRSSVLLLPSSREGAGWVVGEAAACGVPSVVSSGTGAETIVRLSGGMGEAVEQSEKLDIQKFRLAVRRMSEDSHHVPTNRWSAGRLPGFLRSVWFG